MILLILFFVGYYGYKFGKAIDKTVDTYVEVNRKWEKDSINPIDTLKRDVSKVLDSIQENSLRKREILDKKKK